MTAWFTRKIVVRDHYISFEPLTGSGLRGGLDLSGPVSELTSGEPLYVAILGRPAGLIAFIREHLGIGRRFEFVLSKNQALMRLGSPSVQALTLSKLKGLNSVTVGVVRPLKSALAWAAIALFLMLGALAPASALKPNGGTAGSEAVASNLQFGEGQEGDGSGAGEEEAPPRLLLGGLALGALLIAGFRLFISKETFLELSEGGERVIAFVISPSLLEKKDTDVSVADLNRIAQVFRVMKDEEGRP